MRKLLSTLVVTAIFFSGMTQADAYVVSTDSSYTSIIRHHDDFEGVNTEIELTVYNVPPHSSSEVYTSYFSLTCSTSFPILIAYRVSSHFIGGRVLSHGYIQEETKVKVDGGKPYAVKFFKYEYSASQPTNTPEEQLKFINDLRTSKEIAIKYGISTEVFHINKAVRGSIAKFYELCNTVEKKYLP